MAMTTQARPTTDPRIVTRQGPLGVGDSVEVRNRFDERWIHGFAIAVVGPAAYQLRRMSDGYVLPAWFAADVVRADPAT